MTEIEWLSKISKQMEECIDIMHEFSIQLKNLKVSNVPKWGSKISGNEFATTEQLLIEQKRRREEESKAEADHKPTIEELEEIS